MASRERVIPVRIEGVSSPARTPPAATPPPASSAASTTISSVPVATANNAQVLPNVSSAASSATTAARRLSLQSMNNEIGEKIIGMLDEIEKRVENLRETAALMEQEKDSLIEMLNTVQINKDLLHIPQSDKEEIEATTNRLLSRCRTVAVNVSTPRNTEQEKALKLVNDRIDELISKMRDDAVNSEHVCKKFLNACNPEQPDGPIDQKFQAILIECTADDQKKIRKRLEHMLQ
uniref:BAG family molecular chaperone regulator 2 n=1 Tax=Romanomermis culicivorax TaxID=13658 RepID=A0A915KTR6_ROMCU